MRYFPMSGIWGDSFMRQDTRQTGRGGCEISRWGRSGATSPGRTSRPPSRVRRRVDRRTELCEQLRDLDERVVVRAAHAQRLDREITAVARPPHHRHEPLEVEPWRVESAPRRFL